LSGAGVISVVTTASVTQGAPYCSGWSFSSAQAARWDAFAPTGARLVGVSRGAAPTRSPGWAARRARQLSRPPTKETPSRIVLPKSTILRPPMSATTTVPIRAVPATAWPKLRDANRAQLELVLARKPVVWVGAGLSMAAGYPSTGKIIDQMNKEAG